MSPPPPAPTLHAPAALVTRSATIDLAGRLPAGLDRQDAYRLRVYVNDRVVRESDRPARADFKLADIPLEQGENAISVALVGAGGEGRRSSPVSITRDDVVPVIHVSRPEPDSTVYGEIESLRGRTEPGASMTIVDEKTDELVPTTVQPDGRFEATLSLALGQNGLLLRSEDPAGNVARARFVVTRATSLATINLTVTPSELALSDLPAELDIDVVLSDELGQPADGADVTFGLSPPNRATTTYRTTSAAGLATWPGLSLANDGSASGTWLVTVLAVLPSGIELREDESVSVR